ncbi:MAG: DUF2784 family protein [Leptonema sp. (in: bacteria)]
MFGIEKIPYFTLEILDILFHVFHIGVLLWNGFGWMYKKFIKIHFISLNLVFFSWFILGFFYGFGYCFLTDFHWRIKYQKGEYNLPNSYIDYILQKLGFFFSPFLIDIGVLLFTILVYCFSLYRLIKK